MSSLTQGRETTLEEMLALREERAARQRRMLAESGCASLVCLGDGRRRTCSPPWARSWMSG